MLSTSELERYQRQWILEEVGYSGQKRLKQTSVLCVGVGGLGSALSLYLAAAGIGTLAIIDDDVVELSNLQRQVLYKTAECGLSKVIQAKKQLQQLNPEVKVVAYNQRLNADNIIDIVGQYDIVADCSDNFATRYLLNDTCFKLKKINVFACVKQFTGYCSVFTAEGGPCYRCLFPEPPEKLVLNCAQAGVLGVVPGILGTLQANEVLKLVLGIGQPLIAKLCVFDALQSSMRTIELPIAQDCPLCSASNI